MFEEPHQSANVQDKKNPNHLTAHIWMKISYLFHFMFVSYLPHTCSCLTSAVVVRPSRNHILLALQDCLSLILFHSSPVHLNPSIWTRDVHNDFCQLRERAPSISTTCNMLVCVPLYKAITSRKPLEVLIILYY